MPCLLQIGRGLRHEIAAGRAETASASAVGNHHLDRTRKLWAMARSLGISLKVGVTPFLPDMHCPCHHDGPLLALPPLLGPLMTRSPLPPWSPYLPCIRPSVLSQLNTVVCRTNLEDEGMAALVLELRPERWKVFQVREEQ